MSYILTLNMNFLKRGTISILRNPGKSILLLLLVFILGTGISGAISVQRAIHNTEENLRRQMRPIVVADMNYELASSEMMDWTEEEQDEFWLNREGLTADMVRAIGALPQVANFDYILRTTLRSMDLSSFDSGGSMPDMFDLMGTSHEEAVQINQGILELAAGRNFSSSELILNSESRTVVIISEELAQKNNFTLGSVFTLEIFVHRQDDLWYETQAPGGMRWGAWMYEDENLYTTLSFEFEVIGIFSLTEERVEEAITNEEHNIYHRQQRRLNQIFVPNWFIERINLEFSDASVSALEAADIGTAEWREEVVIRQWSVDAVFVLYDPFYIDDFRTASADLLPKFYEIESLSSTFDEIAASMSTLRQIADGVLYASVGATLLVLGLLVTLFLKDRRHELGIYLALGEKKGKIIFQILLEVVVISVMGMSLALFTGYIVSNHMSRNMLIDQLTAEENHIPGEISISIRGTFDLIGIPTTNLSIDEMIEAFDVSLGVNTIGLFYVIGLGTIVLSTVVPMLYVVKLNPKKVLL